MAGCRFGRASVRVADRIELTGFRIGPTVNDTTRSGASFAVSSATVIQFSSICCTVPTAPLNRP
jgi:hypothetical protein